MSFQVSIPIEVVSRILSYTLASPADDPQKLPTARPHPVSTLLICKTTTRLLLPHFYRSITVFKPKDWDTLFNTDYGVLAVNEKDKPKGKRRFPPLAIRQEWVRELVLGLDDGGSPIGLPFNVEEALAEAATWPKWDVEPDWIDSEPMSDFLLRHPTPFKSPRLPSLRTLIMSPLARPNKESEMHKLVTAYIDHVDEDPLELESPESYAAEDPADLQTERFCSLQRLFHQITTLHLPADFSFKLGATNEAVSATFNAHLSIYCAAPHAEAFAYLALDAEELADGDSPLMREAFDCTLGEGRNSPSHKNLVLVGPATHVRMVLDEGNEEMEGWEWLAPDGKRRRPVKAWRKRYDEDEDEDDEK